MLTKPVYVFSMIFLKDFLNRQKIFAFCPMRRNCNTTFFRFFFVCFLFCFFVVVVLKEGEGDF